MAKVYNNLDSFILSGKSQTISYHNTSYCDFFQDICFPIHNILDDYLDELKEKAAQVRLTDEQYEQYKYKPRLLSMYLYDSTEFFFVILALNGIATEKEFTKQTINLLSRKDMKEFLEKIYTSEKQYIDDYNTRRKKEYESEEE